MYLKLEFECSFQAVCNKSIETLLLSSRPLVQPYVPSNIGNIYTEEGGALDQP